MRPLSRWLWLSICIGIGFGIVTVARRAPSFLESFSHPPDGICCASLFSPYDEVTQTLLELIRAEQRSIKIAAYVLTDAMVATELIKAHQRGVRVEIIIDASGLDAKYRSLAVNRLRKELPIYICHADDNGLMHNKFIIFGQNIRRLPILWTGSYNFTYSAQRKNYENVILISHNRTIQSYDRAFDEIKKKCCLLLPRRQLKHIGAPSSMTCTYPI